MIRYHFTPCGSFGYDGPTYTFDQCETYYQEHISPIAIDGVLFQFDEEDFRGGQGFQIPREDAYNVTIAGVAGGRGLCNIYFGHGRMIRFQIQLTPEYREITSYGDSPLDDMEAKDIVEAAQDGTLHHLRSEPLAMTLSASTIT